MKFEQCKRDTIYLLLEENYPTIPDYNILDKKNLSYCILYYQWLQRLSKYSFACIHGVDSLKEDSLLVSALRAYIGERIKHQRW